MHLHLTSVMIVLCVAAASLSVARAAEDIVPLRPPAVPLVAHDPYFSIWSEADRLTDDATRHWTRAKHSLTSLIRLDGRTYRLMGDEPKDVPAMEQTGLTVLPTRTIYRFRGPEAEVTLTFLTPALPDDPDALSRPLTYLTWDVRSADGHRHDAAVYFSASAELTVNSPEQKVVWSRSKADGFTALRIGSEDQPVLERAGDGTRIDWGYAYAAVPEGPSAQAFGAQDVCARRFVTEGKLPDDDTRMPRAVQDDLPVMAFILPMGELGTARVSRFLMLAYDDEYSILYFGKQLRPYWRRNGMDAAGLLTAAARDYCSLQKRCAAFDEALMADLRKVGGERYARLCALAYRQCLAACKLAADAKGMPMLFPKENTSNGCISTVDVLYPMDPMFLFFSPMLAKASLAPVLNYTASPLWKFRYAPHDLGTYPHATRQVYGGDDPAHEGDRMPVEESGNMLLLLAAVAKEEGSAEFASQYWPQVTQWAKYLEEKGFDPENQLCTDDFTGHLAHNANLSVKAIEALAAYGLLCEMRGEKDDALKYRKLAQEMAGRWVQAADDGDHFRLAFDKPGTWSQKYNMVWDRLLGLNVFPPAVIRKEMAFYLRTKDRYGLALDNRQPYAKLDWAVWTATLAENKQDFLALTDPIYDFLNHTPQRNPITDLYWTKTGTEAGMHARPVVGGVFIKMLSDAAIWKKWAGRPANTNAAWDSLPTPPQVKEVVPTAQREGIAWRYTFERPGNGWYEPGFHAEDWKEGAAGFGTAGTPGAVVRTTWNTPDIWIRREFTMPQGSFENLQLRVYHDEEVEVYVNGVLAGRASGFTTDYVLLPLRPAAKAALKPGRNLIAVHCHQTSGGQGVDVGIVDIVER
jgi:hypothetical protein